MSTRLNQPRSGAMVIVMQRLHEADLTGHLVEQGGFAHLCLPAEYEPSHPFVWPEDPRIEEGELLWPERIDADSLAQIKRALGSYGSAGQLQQCPAPAEGAILKRRWWRWWPGRVEEAPRFNQIIQSWDMAFTDTDGSDFVVGQVWGQLGADKYLIHQVRARMEFTETVQAVKDLTAWVEARYPRHRSHLKLVEDKANGPAVISSLRRQVPGLAPVDPKGDKVARARAVAPEVEAGNVHLPGMADAEGTGYDPTQTPDWVRALVEECASFPNAAHDDQVDALSQALMRLAGTTGGLRRRERMAGEMAGVREMEF
jgi:predicted phage terminase large subunit-like protein